MLIHLPIQARAFVAMIIATGAVLLIDSARSLADGSAPTAILLVGLAAITGTCTMKLPRIETRFSLSDALVFTSILLLGPGIAVVVAAVDALAASLRFNCRDQLFVSRTLFNVAAAVVSTWLPACAFFGTGGDQFALGDSPGLSTLVLPLCVLVTTYSLLNTGAIAMVVSLTTRTSIAAVWRENFAWVWVTHAWSGLVAGAIALYVPHVNVVSLLVIFIVFGVGYATVRTHLHQVEESTGHLHKLNDLYLATIQALAMAIDAKDQVTHGHIRRVQVYAVELARAVGVIDEPTLKGIEAGALLHDTGKIAVPEHILNKPGKLTPQEYEKIKSHVTIGADILSGIDFPYPVIPYVRHHHENWDGTGYPDGLVGEDIPLGARILSVVDCFDALTSDRPYRRALTTDAALEILQQRSGSMYDPRLVETFIAQLPRLSELLAAEVGPSSAHPDAVIVEPAPADNVQVIDASSDDLLRLAALGLSPVEATAILLHRLQRRMEFSAAAVYMPDRTGERLTAFHAEGRYAAYYRRSEIRLAEGPSGWVVAHGQLLVNGNPALDLQGPVEGREISLASALVVPFTPPGNTRGALALYAEGPEAFTLADARLALSAATQLTRLFAQVASAGDGSCIMRVA